MRIGILGGTFDPVHIGHLVLAEEALSKLKLDQIWFIPTGKPWLKESLEITDGFNRLEMVKIATKSNPRFVASSIEIDRSGPTYTIDTLRYLKDKLGTETSIYFILGLDTLANFHRWNRPEEILDLCEFVVSNRPGFGNTKILDEQLERFESIGSITTLLNIPMLDISGTNLREMIRQGLSIKYRVPDGVEEYIYSNGLYGADEQQAPVTHHSVVQRLLELAVELGALKYGEFTLSSGKKSSYYFDGRLLSLNPEGAHLIGKSLLPLMHKSSVEAIGGPTLAADPIVTAVSLASYAQGEGIPGFIVRKETKEHGTAQLIEGHIKPGSKVAIVDDTCTTGGSLFHAIQAAESYGCEVVKVIAVLDRREGGTEELIRRGYDFVSLMAANPEGQIEVIN
tara:strand:+ start:433 stop:1620 length:1188 start_codon:yes stop_codon:yes gene_type:complete